MRKKGLVVMGLVLAMSLAGCGGSDDTSVKTEATTQTTTAAKEDTEDKTEAATEEKTEAAEGDKAVASGSVGRYALYEYEANGQVVTNDLLKQAGMDKTYIELKEDGTGEFNLYDQLLDITWKEGEITCYGTSKYGFTVDGDTLTLDMQGVKYVMNHEGGSTADASDKKEDKSEEKSEDKTEEKADNTTTTTGEAPSGDGIVSEEKLQKGYVWLSKIKKDQFKTTYEELAEYYGVEGHFEKEEFSEHMGVNKRYYKWISDEDDTHFIYVNFDEKDAENEPGVYRVSGYNSSGFLGSDAEAAYLDELQGEAKEADKENASNASTASTTYEIFEFGSKENSVKVTLDQPESGWSWDEKKSEIIESDDINTFGAGFIKFTVNKSVDKFDTYMDKFENYTDIEDRVIGGVTMKGRTYDYIGYSWTEYVAELADGKAIAIGIVRVDIEDGTMGDKILNSIKFEY